MRMSEIEKRSWLKEQELTKKDQNWIKKQSKKTYKEYKEGFTKYIDWVGETLNAKELEERCVNAYKNSPQYKIDQLVKKGIPYPKERTNRNVDIDEWLNITMRR